MIKKFLQNIFKRISYSLFSIIYGKIEKSIKSTEDKRIKIAIAKIEENLSYNIYSIKNGRLYTDRIQDTAVIIDKKIIEGPSFQLREKNVNSNVDSNIVFKKGTPRILRNLNGTVLSLLTGGGGNNNYWHWLFDVLPRLKICETVKKLETIDYFLFPDIKEKFQQETLKSLSFPIEKLLSSEKYRHIKTNELIITNHPYMFTEDPHKDAQKIPIWIIKWLRQKFLVNLKASNKNYPKKIYIDRSDSKSNVSQHRTLLNEKEIRHYLKEKNFTFVRLSDLNFSDQVLFFNNADCIIGLHGSGFANLTFCKPNTKVIEFRNSTSGPVIENIAKKNNLNYSSIIIDAKNENLGIQQGHIHVPIKALNEILD